MYFNFEVNLPQDSKKRSVSFSDQTLLQAAQGLQAPGFCRKALTGQNWTRGSERRERKVLCRQGHPLCMGHHSSVFHTVWTKTLWREHQGVTEEKIQWQKKDIVHLFNLTWLTASTVCMGSVLVGLKFERTCGFCILQQSSSIQLVSIIVESMKSHCLNIPLYKISYDWM